MGLQVISGTKSKVAVAVDAVASAVRASLYPPDARGHYRLLATPSHNGNGNPGANANEVAIRNPSDSVLIILTSLKLRWQTVTAFTTAQELRWESFIIKGCTALSGTTQLATTGGFKKRTNYARSVLDDVQLGGQVYASSNSGITITGATANAQSFLGLSVWSQRGAAPDVHPGSEAIWSALTEGPIVLAENEGFVVRNMISNGAVGGGKLQVEMAWSEIESASY